MSFVVTGMGFI